MRASNHSAGGHRRSVVCAGTPLETDLRLRQRPKTAMRSTDRRYFGDWNWSLARDPSSAAVWPPAPSHSLRFGGIAPVVFALAAIFGLPESIKFMTLHESHRAKMEALLKDIRPDFQMPPNPRFVIEDERQAPSSNPIYLFGSGLAVITPLTWLMFACNLMGYFFLISIRDFVRCSILKLSKRASVASDEMVVGFDRRGGLRSCG